LSVDRHEGQKGQGIVYDNGGKRFGLKRFGLSFSTWHDALFSEICDPEKDFPKSNEMM
jgi:hypothetical protein